MAERLNKDNFDSKALQSRKLTLIEFYHDGCISCKMLAPVLGELEDQYEDRLFVGKVNTNFDEELTQRFQVMASPTLIFFKDGKQLLKLTGAKEYEELEEIIEENL